MIGALIHQFTGTLFKVHVEVFYRRKMVKIRETLLERNCIERNLLKKTLSCDVYFYHSHGQQIIILPLSTARPSLPYSLIIYNTSYS